MLDRSIGDELARASAEQAAEGSGRENLRLLGCEFFLSEDSLILEFGQFLQLGDRIRSGGRNRGHRLLLRVLILLLLSPSISLST